MHGKNPNVWVFLVDLWAGMQCCGIEKGDKVGMEWSYQRSSCFVGLTNYQRPFSLKVVHGVVMLIGPKVRTYVEFLYSYLYMNYSAVNWRSFKSARGENEGVRTGHSTGCLYVRGGHSSALVSWHSRHAFCPWIITAIVRVGHRSSLWPEPHRVCSTP